jgi:sulfopyruvate decarboxylase subunit alpha
MPPGDAREATTVNEAQAEQMARALRGAGVDFAAWLPDSGQVRLGERLATDEAVTLVRVFNEGDGIAACAGAWLVGRVPAMIMEDSGLFASVFAVEGVANRFGVPVLMLISYRGDTLDPRNNWVLAQYALRVEDLLKALDVKYHVLDRAADVERAVAGAVGYMRAALRPAALLLTGELLG